MIVSRHSFLEATTAFTTINLFHPAASAPIDSDHLRGTHWRQVWFGKDDKLADFTGLERYSLPDNTFLTLSDHDRWKLRHARPGYKPADQTVHFVRAVDEYIPDENVGLKELITSIKEYRPDMYDQMIEAYGGMDGEHAYNHIARFVGEAHGIDIEGRKLGRALWEELEQAVRAG